MIENMTRREVLTALAIAGVSTTAATDRVLTAVRKSRGTSLMQLHHQQLSPRTLKTEFVSQKEIGSYEEFTEWIKSANDRHPPPEGWCWMACDETADCFMSRPV